jgi:large conductance mechanosensitive channel
MKERRFNMKKKKQSANISKDMLKAGKKAGRIIGEFKEFISKGNVTDMAVGIIVGTSFTAIVNSLVHDVITPLVGLIIGGIDFSALAFTVNSFLFPDLSVTIRYGNFLQSVVSFFIIAVCVFFMVKTLNALRRKKDGGDSPEKTKQDEQILLLTEIRDLLRQSREDLNSSSAANPKSPPP